MVLDLVCLSMNSLRVCSLRLDKKQIGPKREIALLLVWIDRSKRWCLSKFLALCLLNMSANYWQSTRILLRSGGSLGVWALSLVSSSESGRSWQKTASHILQAQQKTFTLMSKMEGFFSLEYPMGLILAISRKQTDLDFRSSGDGSQSWEVGYQQEVSIG